MLQLRSHHPLSYFLRLFKPDFQKTNSGAKSFVTAPWDPVSFYCDACLISRPVSVVTVRVNILPKVLFIPSVLLLHGHKDADNVKWLFHEKNNCSAALCPTHHNLLPNPSVPIFLPVTCAQQSLKNRYWAIPNAICLLQTFWHLF